MATAEARPDGPWWREPTRDQWRAYFASWLGWTLDAFDFTVFLLIMVPISQEFGVPLTAVTAVFTATLVLRFIGAIASGWMADRVGRRLPLMISFVWFSVCNLVAGFSPSFAFLFFFRALLGVGMGAEWSAGSALAMESWPARSRGLMGGLLAGSWGIGFALSSVAYGVLYSHIGWRGLLMLGIVPALAVIWVRFFVREPEVWVENQRQQREKDSVVKLPLLEIFRPQHLRNTLTACWFVASFQSTYYCVWGLFSSYLQETLRWTAAMVAVPLFWGNVIIVIACGFWGMAADRIGRRAAVIVPGSIGILIAPVYLLSTDPAWILAGFLVQNAFGAVVGAQAVSYLAERFPTEIRATAAGFAYHAGTMFSGLVLPVLSFLATGEHLGFAIPILVGTILALISVILSVVYAPETRGKVLTGDLQTRY